jgi:hypothetical protein
MMSHLSDTEVQDKTRRSRIRRGVADLLARLRANSAKSARAPAVLTVLLAAGTAFAAEFHSNPWLLSWIPATCCVTNDCCWEVSERELRPLADDQWEVVATDQVRKRTDWSPDGKFYRCACDYNEGHWIKHQGAFTRCVFVPLRSASR